MPPRCFRGRRYPRREPGCRSGSEWPGRGSLRRGCCRRVGVRNGQLLEDEVWLAKSDGIGEEKNEVLTWSTGALVAPVVVVVGDVEMTEVNIPFRIVVANKGRLEVG